VREFYRRCFGLKGLGAVAPDPVTFASMDDEQQDRIIASMSASDLLAYYRHMRDSDLTGMDGLGALDGFFSKLFKKIKGGLKAILPAAAGLIPIIGPVASQVVSAATSGGRRPAAPTAFVGPPQYPAQVPGAPPAGGGLRISPAMLMVGGLAAVLLLTRSDATNEHRTRTETRQ